MFPSLSLCGCDCAKPHPKPPAQRDHQRRHREDRRRSPRKSSRTYGRQHGAPCLAEFGDGGENGNGSGSVIAGTDDLLIRRKLLGGRNVGGIAVAAVVAEHWYREVRVVSPVHNMNARHRWLLRGGWHQIHKDRCQALDLWSEPKDPRPLLSSIRANDLWIPEVALRDDGLDCRQSPRGLLRTA